MMTRDPDQWWVDPPFLTGHETTQKPEHVLVAFLDGLDRGVGAPTRHDTPEKPDTVIAAFLDGLDDAVGAS